MYDLKSQIFLGQGRYGDALQVINKGCARFPQDHNLAVVKLKVLVKEGLYESAMKAASVQEATLFIKENKTKRGMFFIN